MYLSLSKKYLEENRKAMEKEALEQSGDDGKDDLLYTDEKEAKIEHIEKNNITLSCDSKIGYLSIDVDLSDEDIFELIDYMREKANKMKKMLILADEGGK